MKKLNIIIGCECTGVVRDAFAALGHNAWSCDLKPTEAPGNHIQDDIIKTINEGGGGYWDFGIFHPPCTFVARCSEQWLYNPEDKHLPPRKRRPNPLYPERKNDMLKAITFFQTLINCKIPKIVMEQPLLMQQVLNIVGKPSQIIQPYWFGDNAQKTTCLWLKNVPYLYPTNPVHKGEFVTFSSGKKMPKWYADAKQGEKENTQSTRSKTFPGIAQAMAMQWGSDNKFKNELF